MKQLQTKTTLKKRIALKIIQFGFYLIRNKNKDNFQVRLMADLNGEFYGTTHTFSKGTWPAARHRLQDIFVSMTAGITRDLKEYAQDYLDERIKLAAEDGEELTLNEKDLIYESYLAGFRKGNK
jgi:hypothetical protein